MGFEPDLEEANRLNESAPDNVTYVPVALGETDHSSSILHVTQQPACSSVYPPVVALYEKYPALSEIRPEKNVVVPSRTLDAVLAERGITSVDSIKLDTQGSELDLLKGSRKSLKTVLFLM